MPPVEMLSDTVVTLPLASLVAEKDEPPFASAIALEAAPFTLLNVMAAEEAGIVPGAGTATGTELLGAETVGGGLPPPPPPQETSKVASAISDSFFIAWLLRPEKRSPKTLNAGRNLRFPKLWSEIPKSHIGHPVEGVAFDGGRVPGTARYRRRPAARKRKDRP